MSIEVKVPVLPESVADATVSVWHKKPGDAVSRDENLVDIETDKVVLEVPSPQDGIVKEIVQTEGATVTANQVIAILEPNGAAGKPVTQKTEQQPAAEKSAGKTAANDGEPALSPSVRKLIAEHGLDAGDITGSGKDGRILKEDVLSALDNKKSGKAGTAIAKPPTQPISEPRPEKPAIESDGPRTEKRVPMTRLRARIAERLLEAQANAAILTTFNEVNMKPVMDMRNRYKDRFEKQHKVKLGFMSFFIKASVEALKRFPAVNASIDGNDIVYHGYYDIGVAVSSPRGLVVPILRNAELMSMAALESKIVEYGNKAKDGTLALDDMTGGTFTVSNGGVFGSLLSTPILNPPQSAILGMHKIEERPVVENGEIVARPMMYLALSYDHRIIDGREAVQFLVTIKELLEDPARILLEL
ncbi:MAG TPA: 2-oxoglutarate dehydrogenase complex dihydrolipoyllysine-residue succinyltransferase [Gammaproteobacteria bacterium]|jgi:2-oxoglutarate dehydrogenase E2 component (dihydrolipoamide succinyltransferase)